MPAHVPYPRVFSCPEIADGAGIRTDVWWTAPEWDVPQVSGAQGRKVARGEWRSFASWSRTSRVMVFLARSLGSMLGLRGSALDGEAGGSDGAGPGLGWTIEAGSTKLGAALIQRIDTRRRKKAALWEAYQPCGMVSSGA